LAHEGGHVDVGGDETRDQHLGAGVGLDGWEDVVAQVVHEGGGVVPRVDRQSACIDTFGVATAR
jgi:hypothetical protein